MTELQIRHLYIAKGHSYFGRYGQAPADFPIEEVSQVQCVAGRGLEGDRFFGYKEDYKGQVTFFALEQYERLCGLFHVYDRSPAVFRRNVITSGVELNALIGQDFEIQGVRFRGTAECSPCEWMDQAFHKGAKEALRGQGGLRARILSTGVLAVV